LFQLPSFLGGEGLGAVLSALVLVGLAHEAPGALVLRSLALVVHHELLGVKVGGQSPSSMYPAISRNRADSAGLGSRRTAWESLGGGSLGR
jgi:hypothetical protein